MNKEQELTLAQERINNVLLKAGLLMEGKHYLSLIAYGYATLLVSEVSAGGRKSVFNCKISEINASDVATASGEVDFVVEIIMAYSDKVGGRQLKKLEIGELSNITKVTFDPLFQEGKEFEMTTMMSIITSN